MIHHRAVMETGVHVRIIVLFFLTLWAANSALAASSKPNIVIILADDLGYGDLSIQGHPLIRTPNIDQLAREGQRWTSFYASAPVCGPSRMALMTGRMPARITGTGKNAWIALPDEEVTLAEMLKKSGYATAYVGKWGLALDSFDYAGGHPNDQGFDYFFGMVTSNDYPVRKGFSLTYESVKNATSEDFPISLYRQRQVIEEPAYQPTLTRRYTEESLKWMSLQKDKPFLLFLAHNMPHVPLFRSPVFEGRSKGGLYGDVVEELDWSVGQVVDALHKLGVSDNTLIIFSSDNGPWLTYYDLGGSPGPFRDGKGTVWEGGFRVPAIFFWPGTIKPAVIDGIGSNVDILKTIAAVAGISLPEDRVLDSMDLSPTLLRGEPSGRREWFFYGWPGDLWAARIGNHKLVFESWDSVGTVQSAEGGYGNHRVHVPPLLYDLSTDASERLVLPGQDAEIAERIKDAVKRHRSFLMAQP